MSTARLYKRPPVTEAAIELRLASSVAQSTLERAGARFDRDYPISEAELAQKINVDPSVGSATFSSTWAGIKRSSADRTDVIIFRTGAVVVAHLAPHKGWDHLFDSVKTAWNVLARTSGENIAVARVGVRYINRIDVPDSSPSYPLWDYVLFRPQTPSNLVDEGSVTEYNSQLVYKMLDDEFSVRLAVASAPSPLVFHRSIILDIDVFREGGIPRKADDIWQLLLTMRERKNEIFEVCITDKARELFDR
jgi:uncharacterized protein (TIGR04255 family)